MRCLIRSHRQDYKLPLPNEEAEQAGSLEPDPRYIRCCSAVCRPGYALRDALLGLLVLLGLSVVVTVIFVVCFYVIPDEKQLIDEGILAATAKGVIRGPEHLNEVTLQEGDKYSLPPHNFEDDHSLDESVDPQQDLPQDFSTFAPPSGEMKDTTDPTMLLQDENQDAMFGQDSPIEHHEEILSDEVLQPRENFDIHLLEESNIPEPEPSDGLHEEPEVHNEHGHSQGSQDQEHHGSQAGCTAVQLPMCISSVPWTMTGSPNWMAHTSEEEMFAALPYIRSSLLDSGCSSLAPLFACSILEPPCQNSKVLPPCRAFCEEVAQSCQSFIQGASLPGLFHCARYPDSADPSVCISAQQDVNRDAANREEPSVQPLKEADTSTNTNRPNDSTTEKTQDSQNAVITVNEEPVIVSTSPTIFAPAPPINDLTTTNAMADSEDTPVDISSPTALSLADRLKLAMSKSTAKPSNPKAPTERIQRHSVSPSVQTFSTINTEDGLTPGGMSLAERLSTVTTERVRRFRTTPQPSTIVSTHSNIQPQNDNSRDTVSDETDNAAPTGVMSLAELLALSNKAKSSSKPSNRTPPRRRIASSGGNRLADQLAEASVTTTERFDSTPTRFRFRGNARPSSPTHTRFIEDDDEDERRIPVRTVGEVPKIKFTFPMRNPLSKPIPFRTTAEPPTKEELLAAVTARTISRAPFSSRFIPSTTTEQTETTKISTTTVEATTTTTPATTTISLPATSPRSPDPIPSVESCPELQCLDGKCIAIIQLNDGVIDCSDGSDEQDFGGLVT